MENIEQEIMHYLAFEYATLERFGLLRVLGKTWESVMKEQSKIPIFDIDIILPPNFFESKINKLENNRYMIKNIGIKYTAIIEDPNNNESDEEGFIYRDGRCKASIVVEVLISDQEIKMKSITPIEFKFEKVPEWLDKGSYYEISEWITYWISYEYNLSLSFIEWFGIKNEAAKRWIEEQTVPKNFEQKKKDYEFKYNHNLNIAEEMFPWK